MPLTNDQLADLESLLQGDKEIVLFKVPDFTKTGVKQGQYGVGYYNPTKTMPDYLDMDECEYGKTLAEAVVGALRRWV